MTFRFTATFVPLAIMRAFGIIKVNARGGDMRVLLTAAATYFSFMGFQAAGLTYTTSIISGILFAVIPVFALRTLPAMNATIFGNVSTAISVVAGALVLGEPLYPDRMHRAHNSWRRRNEHSDGEGAAGR